MKKITVVIDMQNDFLIGSLPNPDAVSIIPSILNEIKDSDFVIYTRDTHGSDYFETQEGKKLPIKHCIKDTWGVAMKATYGVFGDKELMIYKDPKTDTDNLKKSHKGLIFVEKDGDGFKVTDGLLQNTYKEYRRTHEFALRPVFINGDMFNRESFTTIRERLANEK